MMMSLRENLLRRRSLRGWHRFGFAGAGRYSSPLSPNQPQSVEKLCGLVLRDAAFRIGGLEEARQ